MTRNELNHLKLDVYKNYIEQHYGKDRYDKFEIAVNRSIKEKDFEVRSKDFVDKLINIDIDN